MGDLKGLSNPDHSLILCLAPSFHFCVLGEERPWKYESCLGDCDCSNWCMLIGNRIDLLSLIIASKRDNTFQ